MDAEPVDPDAEPDANPDADPDADPDANPDADPDANPDADPDAGPDVDPDADPNVNPTPNPTPNPNPEPEPEPLACTFTPDGWTCDDGTECTADANGDTLDENGEEGCDHICAPDGKDAAGMDCTPAVPDDGGRRLAVQDKIAFGQN